MKKKWLCRFLGFFAACGAALAGFAGIQRLLLFLAQKKDSPVPFEEQFRSSQGEIACRSMGHGRPLLLVHSMMPGASSAEWEPVLDALAEHYHVYAIDLLGFGHSFRPEKPWTAYQYANLLHEFIQDTRGYETPALPAFAHCRYAEIPDGYLEGENTRTAGKRFFRKRKSHAGADSALQ